MSNEVFNWSGPDVIVSKQAAVAVYENERGEVVIRQEGDMGEDDHFVYVAFHHLPALMEKLKRYLQD